MSMCSVFYKSTTRFLYIAPCICIACTYKQTKVKQLRKNEPQLKLIVEVSTPFGRLVPVFIPLSTYSFHCSSWQALRFQGTMFQEQQATFMEEEPIQKCTSKLVESKSNGKIILDLHLKYGENHSHIKSRIYKIRTFTSNGNIRA